MSERYDDIISLPHHVSATRARMSASDRAAQFSPFAALTGFGAVITEAGRLTQTRIELDEDEKQALNEKLAMICRLDTPSVCLTYFQPDEKKDGGAYLTVSGKIKRIDEYARQLVFADERRVSIDDIIGISAEDSHVD